jgi:hypothetical protein
MGDEEQGKFSHDLKTLNLADLALFEKSLIAKLMLVSNELRKRYTNLMGLATGEEDRKVLAEGVAWRIKLHAILQAELARVLEPEGSSQRNDDGDHGPSNPQTS